ncbi:MAG TPA: sigma-54 dependent transcriptional regulator [Planctomycetota bacterium]|nr:sigma-54 dependent transcriptional regulator [Planctomycetota bacterium]HRT93045.1 sigma-54 dependent transcriptional regulator [Planctomycetota bacterium]
MPRALIVDDDPTVAKYLAGFLGQHGYTVRAVTDAREAARAAQEFQPDAAVLDLMMPDRDGLDLLPELKAACPRCQVIIYTGAGDIEKAVQAMRRGAHDFIQKPLNYEALLLSLQRALEVRHLRAENAFLRQAYQTRLGPAAILVFSDATRRLLELADRYRALPDMPVLIEGESGVGKDLVAHYIHHRDDDYSRPFVAINCGAIPRTLVEAELFGYAPGAFTGARADGAPGMIRSADGGTLFLDEIGELDMGSQVKLLRFLEQGTFYPVGSPREVTVRARILSATNRDLREAVARGLFRRDLYYRLHVGHLRVPPLRERREEILPFARHFLREFAERFDNPFRQIAPEAEQILLQSPWHGNVRELRNVIERVVLTQRGPVVEARHLAFLSGESPPASVPPAEAPLPESGLDLEATMRRLIQRALEKHGYNQSRTARYLGISREALRYRMKKVPIPSGHPE